MSKFIFTEDDFYRFWNEAITSGVTDKTLAARCARIANALLTGHLNSLPTVYGASIYDGHGDDGFTSWLEERQKFATHKAKLFDIEKVEGE